MFLQRGRFFNQKHQSPSQSPKHTTRLDQILRNMNIPEIKSHVKNAPKATPRNHLISRTNYFFKKQKPKVNNENRANSTQSRMSRRQCRTAAARMMRQKLSRPSDIVSLMKTQQRISQSQLLPMDSSNHLEKVGRYQDLLKQFSQQIKAQKKQILKSFYLSNNIRSSQRPQSSRNPEVPVTNIEFGGRQDKDSKLTKKREIRRGNYSFTSYGKRLNKNHSRNLEQNYIQPW